MDIKLAYKIMQEASGIKVGDRVKILRNFGENELGSSVVDGRIEGDKQKAIKDRVTGTVTEVLDSHLWVDCGRKYSGCWAFPFFVFEVVEKAKSENMIKVDGKEYSEATLKKMIQQYTK